MFNFSFEIDEDGAAKVFDGVNELPFVYQPCWPNGQPWQDDQATKWAEQLILSLTDEAADLPGLSPDEPTVARATPLVQEITEEITEE